MHVRLSLLNLVHQASAKLQDFLPEQSLPVNPVGQSHISVLVFKVPPFRHISSAHELHSF